MNTQMIIEFSNKIRPHNNIESMLQADRFKIHFSSQDQWTLAQLIAGRVVNSDMAKEEYKIKDLRARIHSLKKMQIDIRFRVIPNSNGCREYYLTEEEIQRLLRMC